MLIVLSRSMSRTFSRVCGRCGRLALRTLQQQLTASRAFRLYSSSGASLITQHHGRSHSRLAEPLPAPREQPENLCPRVSAKGCTERNVTYSGTRQKHPNTISPYSLNRRPDSLKQADPESHPMMTASPPAQQTPPQTLSDEADSPASKPPAQQSMQSPVPARPEPSSHTMHPIEPHPVARAGDPDHTSRHDEYEVVEVEEGEAGMEEAPKGTFSRPPLPRLNSQSRAASSPAPFHETTPPQHPPRQSSYRSTPQPQQGRPVHLQGSREIPIPMRTSSTQNQTGPEVSTPPATETTDTGTDEGAQDAKSSSQDTPKPQEKNAPIAIPKVTPLSSDLRLPPNLAELAQGLDGKYVDEFGNILDWNGQVLGRVEGDLPSMIGRPVSVTGEIFSEDGEVVGYVAENDTIPPTPPSPKPIEGMGDGLKVDHMGNILDKNNNVVGHFDGAPLAKSVQQTGQTSSSGDSSSPRPGYMPDTHTSCPQCTAHRQSKPSATTPSPSEIFMDVKSTNDGIQLIIKIPTVFHGGGNPNIHIGTR
ncbi:hypothetical protein CORC01_13987 [Colletotrichum orchidophilum]|uniref:LEA domain-containing protein n=1 Tax=Colletotrichum orchidophilum TaxID=1209926 RepID=A0A1G4ANN8_9PEZI|nr:uncharacterized protein CORC01_13987 [Colletotrichum orchidophilum]OHE90705.1 hypothetical protein CORC01_13987 [Colletotrichum orchidophilum]